MATYASKDDIDRLYGDSLLVRIADLDRDGIPDETLVERGLVAADDLINAYLSTRYTLPLVGTSPVLRDCAVDIAVYKIALERAKRTDEMRIRYDDALALLDKMAAGKIGLGIPPSDENDDGVVSDTRTNVGRSINTYRA